MLWFWGAVCLVYWTLPLRRYPGSSISLLFHIYFASYHSYIIIFNANQLIFELRSCSLASDSWSSCPNFPATESTGPCDNTWFLILYTESNQMTFACFVFLLCISACVCMHCGLYDRVCVCVGQRRNFRSQLSSSTMYLNRDCQAWLWASLPVESFFSIHKYNFNKV